MAVRATGTFKSPATSPIGPDQEREYRVDIHDTDFSGEPIEIIILSCDASWEPEREDDRHAPIFSSKANVTINVPATDTSLTTFIEDMAYAEDGRFLLEITRDSGATIMWRGIVKPDQSAEADIDPFPFRISAVCGLSTLKSKPFMNNALNLPYYGIKRFTEMIVLALGNMAHLGTFWGAGDTLIRTAVDWWSTAMSSGTDDDALYQSGARVFAFYKDQTDGPVEDTYINCYDVIAEVMRTFGCRIYQSEGHYKIDQISYRNSATYFARDYDKDGAFISSDTYSGVNVINQTMSGAKITLVTYDFLPILKKVRVFYNARKRRNILNGHFFDNNNEGTVFDQFIDSNNGQAVIRIRGLFNYSVKNTGYTGGVTDTFFVVPNFEFKMGIHYLSRNYTISNYTANLQAASWSLSSAARVYLPHLIGKVPALGETNTGYYSFEILSPALPADSTTNEIFCAGPSMVKWNGVVWPLSDFLIDWSFSGLYVDMFDSGAVTEYADQVCFEAVNPAAASEKYDIHLKLGNSDSDTDSVGRIYYTADGSTWDEADVWGEGTDPRAKHICDLLALDILHGQSSARRRMSGKLYGSFRNLRLIQTSDDRKWMFSRVKWDFTQNELSGSWIELEYGADGVSSTPVRVHVVKGGGLTFPPVFDPANPNGLSNGSPGFSINTSPAVLAPVSYNQLDSEILEGATITSIPTKVPSDGNEFLAGDSVGIVDPYTGQFQYFEIATPPAAGDTSLSVVSDTALYDFPEDSYLTVKQRPYAYTPGNWYTFKGTIASNKVTVTGFDLPANDDACYVIVRRQFYTSPDDFTINYGDNSVNFLSGLGLNGQTALVRAYA